jgi:outer membrane protein assembly factor BamB
VVGSRDKHVRAWQRQTGKELWAFATKGRVDSSPVVVDQRVFVGSVDGHLYVLELARGTELARFALGPITNSPAVGGQSVVVATVDGEIYCLGAKK